jgi:hypothetical protein
MAPDLAMDLAEASLTLAQRFSDGATMWCVAPQFSPHAQHIAVEFVHPVVVGKRALPAVALTGADLVAQVRLSARPGDVVIACAGADDPDVRAIMHRAAAWGLTTIWIGNGERPQIGAADHVLWLDDPDPTLAATGEFVLIYHLLWELTHVCFEHPGLLTFRSSACTDDVCITCSDEGRPAEILDTTPDGSASVRTAAGLEDVVMILPGTYVPGDVVLIHAGLVISKVKEA